VFVDAYSLTQYFAGQFLQHPVPPALSIGSFRVCGCQMESRSPRQGDDRCPDPCHQPGGTPTPPPVAGIPQDVVVIYFTLRTADGPEAEAAADATCQSLRDRLQRHCPCVHSTPLPSPLHRGCGVVTDARGDQSRAPIPADSLTPPFTALLCRRETDGGDPRVPADPPVWSHGSLLAFLSTNASIHKANQMRNYAIHMSGQKDFRRIKISLQ